MQVAGLVDVAERLRLLNVWYGLVGGGWQEYDFTVGRFGHGLHSLEIADLHSRCGGQNVGGLAHKFGGFDLTCQVLVWIRGWIRGEVCNIPRPLR